MRDRFTRPIFGPFRRRAHTGVPADHFPKASEMLRHGDGVHVLVADGAPAVEIPLAAMSETQRREADAANEITDPVELAALVASAFDKAGGVEAWTKLREAKGLTAATLPDGSVEPASWHAYLTCEGLRTDDNREFPIGCFRYGLLPQSMRILVEDEGGHWGAVTCGRTDTIEPRQFPPLVAHYAEGVFGSDLNGQLAELMVEEQTQRFVSVDMRDMTVEYIEVVVSRTPAMGLLDGDDYAPLVDSWIRYVDTTIGAATILSIPAMPQAVIALANVDLPEPALETSTRPAGSEPVGDVELDDEDDALAASGAPPAAPAAPALPRAEWFDDPGFYLGDPRMVLQADNKSYACPLTVGDADPETGLRPVFAHVAWWNCEHTGFPGKKIKPPRSASSYAYYLTGPGVQCAGGALVAGVGNVTMGCGHAPTFKKVGDRKVAVGASEAIAHYDGGYGAVQVMTVRAGQDDFGPWIAGFIRPDVTDEQLAEAMTLAPSGDWREIAGALDMVAVLLVPVPGFPVRRALSASAGGEVDEVGLHAAMKGDRVLALVAAGQVRRVDPGARIAHLERSLSAALDRIGVLEAGLPPAPDPVADAKERFGL